MSMQRQTASSTKTATPTQGGLLQRNPSGLAINRLGDIYEQEADRVAESVVGGRSVATNPRISKPTIQRQEAPEKPREQPTTFPVAEPPKQGKEKEDAEKDKRIEVIKKTGGKIAEMLLDGFSQSQIGKHIFAQEEHNWQTVIKFFEDFADNWVGKIVLGAVAGGAATGAFLGARSARDEIVIPDPASGGAPLSRAPKDENHFALELKWDFISPIAGIKTKTPWLDSPQFGGGSKNTTPTHQPAPQLIKPTQKIPKICTPADPNGDNGEADARSAQIYSWLLWRQQQDAEKMNELVRKNMQPLHAPGEIWRLGQPSTFSSSLTPLFKRADGATEVADPQAIEAGLHSSAQALDATTRADMELRFGYDFSHVRIHTDARAADSARAVSALAYTVGRDVVFGAGQHQPQSSSGRRLMAHELTHVVQQASNSKGTDASSLRVSQSGDVGELEADHMAGQVSASSFTHGRAHSNRQTRSGRSVQRQESGKPVPITARTVFPYPEKSRLALNRLLSDDQIESLARFAGSGPNAVLAARILRASEGQVAVVVSARDDLFEAVIASVKLPKDEAGPEQTVANVAVRFSRQADGKFLFELKAGPTTLFDQGGLAASAMSDSEIGLSSGKGPTVIVRSDAKSGQRDIVGDVGPFEIEALRLTRLPDAPAGSAVEKEAIQQITQKAQETRRERKQEITLGAGAQSGAKLDPVFSASWRMSINPSVKTAGSVQIPLRIDIDYAPNSSVLVGVSAGGEVAIPTKLPVNVRIVGGIAGGALEGTTPGGGKTPLLPVIGPTIGAGIGIGSKTFRMEFDYQRLQNLAHSSPNVDTFIVSGGVKF